LLRLSGNVSFFAISSSVSNAWINYLRINPQRIPVIPNSINSSYFLYEAPEKKLGALLTQATSTSAQSRTILFVGRLLTSKGVDTIYAGLKPFLISRNLHLVFVGRADNSETPKDATMLADMQNEIQQSAWRDRVHFLGLRTDIPEIMAASDLLVHPALTEGFGLVLAEALAVGLPVVASNVDGIPEVLAGTDSVMVPPNDPDALATAVFSVFGWSDEERITAITKGKLRAESYRTEKRALAILELFKQE
jgi:glycosyltransferase involved in cell wall biosynthesis